MADHKKPNQEKSKPSINFNVFFPMNFPISTTDSLSKKFMATLGDSSTNANKFLKKKFLEEFGVSEPRELLKKFPDINESFLQFKNEIKKEMAVTNFSKWGRDVIKKRVDDYGEQKDNN